MLRLSPTAGKRSWQKTVLASFIFAVIALVLLFASLMDLERVPPVWWDEGWTMMVARNWIVDGFYGRYLAGQPSPPGLEGHYPIVASVAMSFRYLGVGLWQARLPGVLYTLAAIGLAFYLAFRLYGIGAAWGTLAALLLFIGRPEINPIMIGRQILGDMPVVFFLLAGYTALVLAAQTSWFVLLLAMVHFGLALAAKSQTPPFWLLAMVVPIGWSAIRRRWKMFLILGLTTAGSWMAYHGATFLKDMVLNGHTLPPIRLTELFGITALVLDPNLRLKSFNTALSFTLATLVGIVFSLPSMFRILFKSVEPVFDASIRLSLWLLAGSWLGWYLLFSNGGNRYLAVPAFLASIFSGAMLDRLTGHFSLRETLKRSAAMLHDRRLSLDGLGAFLVLILLMIAVPSTLGTYISFWMGKDDSAQRLAQAINQTTARDSLIESYDSELLFFVDRPHHYPPDNVHVSLLRSYLLGTQNPFDYDPLAADPDYLVIGEVSRDWKLYDDILERGKFSLLRDEGRYQLYERIR